jgi:hypothetical protein
MQFFIDGNACTPVINAPSPVKTFTVTNIPCSLVGVKNGKHNITAVATDTAGNKGTSMQIEINVSNPFLPPSNLRIVKILSIKYFKFGKG